MQPGKELYNVCIVSLSASCTMLVWLTNKVKTYCICMRVSTLDIALAVCICVSVTLGVSVCSSQSSRRSPEKKSRDLTSTAAFKTAKSSPRWKGLGMTAEEDNDALYVTASDKSHKKSVRTSKAPFRCV